MKAILMSIQPKWCEKIFSGEKTIEVRNSAPKEVPFKAYIYQTKKRWIYKLLPWLKERQGKVIGEFVCDKIDCYPYGDLSYPTPAYEGDDSIYKCDDGYWITCEELDKTCLSYEELENYGKNKLLFGWHISDLKIYDEPKRLGEFLTPSGTGGVWGNHYLSRPPAVVDVCGGVIKKMCKECKKLFELYAETQLECVKNNKYISKIIIDKCPRCGDNIYIAAQISENTHNC